MFANIAEIITDKLEKNGAFISEDRDIYLYGAQHGLNMLLFLCSVALIGFVLNVFWYIILFLIAFVPLRRFAGGHHASTQLKCHIVSTVALVCIGLAPRFVNIHGTLMVVLILALGSFIMLMAPIGTKNKPLDALEVKVYGKKARKICVIEIVIAILCILIGIPAITTGIFWSFVMVLLLLVLGKLLGDKGDITLDE